MESMGIMRLGSFLMQGGVEDGSGLVGVKESVVPILKLLSMSLIGFVLAHERVKVITHEGFNLLSKLVFALFLPCLVFTELGSSIALHSIKDWGIIIANALLNVFIGCLLGYLVALVCRPPPQFFRLTIIMTGIGNTGNIPLAIVGSLCHTNNTSFGTDCNRNGVAFVSFSSWVQLIIMYTFVYHMLEPPEEFYELVPAESDRDGITVIPEEEEREEEETETNMPLLLEAEWPGVKTAQNIDSRMPLLFRSVSITLGSGVPDDAVRCLVEPKMVKKMRVVAKKTPIQHILQPPTIASILAVIVGVSPGLRKLLFTEDAPLSFVTDSLAILAAAVVPSVMLVLGGLMSGGPPVRSELGLRTIIGICVARLLLLPCIGFGVLLMASKLGFFEEKSLMFPFVIFLHYTMPSAILLGSMTSLRGYGQKEASALLFWQHIMAIFSLAFNISVFFSILKYI